MITIPNSIEFLNLQIRIVVILAFALLRFASQETCHALCACHRFACFGDCHEMLTHFSQ
ncbi:MAG: hypothetical protein IJ923_02450 [Campylobacter sp.]|nr:hypothetical protein [Campylobacter sp.]